MGANWVLTRRFEKNILKKAMHEFTPWTLEAFGYGMHVTTNDEFPGVAKIHNILGAANVFDMCSVAINAYKQDVRQPGK